MVRFVSVVVVVCSLSLSAVAQQHVTVTHEVPASPIITRTQTETARISPARTETTAITRDVTPLNVIGTYGDVLTDGLASPYAAQGVLLHAKTAGRPDAGVKLGDAGGFSIFAVNDTRLFRVTGTGTTIGSISAQSRFGVVETSGIGFASYALNDFTTPNGTSVYTTGAGNTGSQNVAAGTSSSGAAVGTYSAGVKGGAGAGYRAIGLLGYGGIATDGAGTLTQGIGVLAQVGQGGGSVEHGYGLFVNDIAATNAWGVYQDGTNDKNLFRGNVGIGITPAYPLHVNGDGRITGNLVVDGNLGAKFQDVAEWVPASVDLAPGTVVVLDPTASNHVIASGRSYDTSVAGVVSERPGLILGEPGDAKEQIATTGRVKVRVDATAGAIAIGDLLVTSSNPGTAMKSHPIDLGGAAIHRPGTIIGKALEPLASGQGEILVLLSLQ